MEPEKKQVGRPRGEASDEGRGPCLKLTLPVDRLLTTAAKKLGIGKSQYASLAVSYFAENGLDPQNTTGVTLAKLHGKVGAEAVNTRQHSAAIGNRLAAILHTGERNQGVYLQNQQIDLLDYLEQIERNILTFLLGMEEQVLGPLLEHTLRNGVEGYLTRALVQQIIVNLQASEMDASSRSEWHQEITKYDESRERKTKEIMEKVAAATRLKKPSLSSRPDVPLPPEHDSDPMPTS